MTWDGTNMQITHSSGRPTVHERFNRSSDDSSAVTGYIAESCLWPHRSVLPEIVDDCADDAAYDPTYSHNQSDDFPHSFDTDLALKTCV